MAKRPAPGAPPARAGRAPDLRSLSVTGLGLLIGLLLGALLATASITPVITPVGVSAPPQIQLAAVSVPDAGGTHSPAVTEPARPKHPSIPTPPAPPAPPPMPAIPAPPVPAAADPDSTPSISDPSVASPADTSPSVQAAPAPPAAAPELPPTPAVPETGTTPALPSYPAGVPTAPAAPGAGTPAALPQALPSAQAPAAATTTPGTTPGTTPALPGTPGLPAAAPALPGTTPPGTAAPAAVPGQAAPASCATAWALAPANGGLAIPNVPNATTLCGAGAIRPTPLTTACTKQVDGAGLQAAVDAAKPGDRICATGTSPQRLKVTRSGTAAAPILVLGDGRITVKGLSIDANNVTVGGLNLTGAAAPGVEMTGNGITLVNNTIASPRGGDGDGIRFFGSNLRILHNTVSDVRNLHGAHADCMQTFSSDTPPSQHVLIDSNRCDKIDNQCLIAEGPNSSAGDGSGKGNSSDITFTRNYCDSNASQAVMIDDVQNVSVTHNQITGGNEKAFAFDNKSTGAKVLGNILGLHIGFEVGMDGSSKHGYLGPLIGGLP
ncbi:MAG TPA: right-handed parallel beta-helix repeat-containing protein [Pseudonocardia sp.]|nr:right-handed parallel beta-helix repeat-containing protein [Pseudonocardia sp.]